MSSIDGAHAEHRRPDADADEAGLADRRVDDALRPELLEEALGDLVGAVELADLLAHDDDVRVAGQLLGQGLADGFAVLDGRASLS